MSFAERCTLAGRHATLVPLSHAHQADLIEAVCDGELWTLWYTTVPSPEGVAAEIDRRLALEESGSMLPFAVIENASGQAVGMTTYMHIEPDSRRLEIGSTWYRRRVQRTAINSECKLLLLEHAFERLACIAVELRTHFHNRQSRAGIERLGARLDGILRQHMIGAGGILRDTCVYSILDREWPAVKANLEHQLSKPRDAAMAATPGG
jgi:RimJ/RimL family protein N-acetyltransferase